MGGRKTGAQRREIVCGCGFRMGGRPERLDVIFRLHRKKCPKTVEGEKYIIPSKMPWDDQYLNSTFGGLSCSRRGNPLVANKDIITQHFEEDKIIYYEKLDRSDIQSDEKVAEIMKERALETDLSGAIIR